MAENTGSYSNPVLEGPAPAASEAGRRFSVLVSRYLRGELTGRSILLGGSRGSGKTLMVHSTLARIALPSEDPNGLSNQYREPLLVPLYGPLLLAPPAKDGTETPPLVEELLRTLVKALHHAVLRRVIRAMAETPVNLPTRVHVERAELAEQLRVDMMRSDINLTRLRHWWQHAEGLPQGLLFPEAGRLQGYREVSTVWALSQIYMMISGSYQKTRQQTESASKEAAVRANATMEGRNLVNPLIGLLSGGVMAAGLFNTSPVLAAVSSILTAVGATTTLNITSDRILKSAEANTLDFKEDLSPKALRRWLPHILQQLREIGLYPIFLVDELDQLKTEEEQRTFSDSFKLLRGMLNESAFFCFIVDQGWFQKVEGDYQAAVPDASASLFTDRLFISHMPSDLRKFVANLAHPDPGAPDPPEVWQQWSWILSHRARSQPARLRDVLARYTDGEDPLYTHQDPKGWPLKGELLLQVAIEHVLEHGALYVLLREHPSWLQMALEMLYLPSNLWEAGEEVNLDEAVVRAYLASRSSVNPAQSQTLFQLLMTQLIELCEILTDPSRIADTDEEKALLSGIGPLLIKVEARRYRWLRSWLLG